MNERIKELALQAGYAPLPGFDFANDLQEVFLQKFAELIVQECVRVALKERVDESDIYSESNPLVFEYLKGNNAGVIDAACAIRQHFGVE